MRVVSEYPPAVSFLAFVTFGDEARQAPERVERDLVEELGGVPVSEIARPAAQEPVEVPHDDLDRDPEPRACRDLTDALAGVSHGLTRGPADEKGEMPRPWGVAAHVAMMEAKEIQPLASLSQLHDPGLRLLELKAHLGEDRGERLEGVLGIPPGLAYRQQIVCVAQQYPVFSLGPLPVKPVQINVAQ